MLHLSCPNFDATVRDFEPVTYIRIKVSSFSNICATIPPCNCTFTFTTLSVHILFSQTTIMFGLTESHCLVLSNILNRHKNNQSVIFQINILKVEM